MKEKLPRLRYKVLKIMDYIAHDLKVIEKANTRIQTNFDRLWLMIAKTTRKDD